MNTLNVALDVIREALARKLLLGLFITITVSFFLLIFALDLEVVEGTLAATKVFGLEMHNPIVPVDVVVGQIFYFLALFVFYWGLIFGLLATAGIATDMLAPGRVEFLLSLPIRRYELVFGTFLGVFLIAAITTTYAVGGMSLILYIKTGVATSAPVYGALMAIVGFAPIYAFMLFVTTLIRSTVAAAGGGMMLFVLSAVTSNRERFLAFYSPGFWRDALEVLISPLPKTAVLAEIGAKAATGEIDVMAVFFPAFGNVMLFALAFVGAAAVIVSSKDY